MERIIDRVGGEDPQLRMVEIEGIDLALVPGPTYLHGPNRGITIDRVQNKGKGTFRSISP